MITTKGEKLNIEIDRDMLKNYKIGLIKVIKGLTEDKSAGFSLDNYADGIFFTCDLLQELIEEESD